MITDCRMILIDLFDIDYDTSTPYGGLISTELMGVENDTSK